MAASTENTIGNVQLPTLCVINNPGDMRAAIDEAIVIDQGKWAGVGDAAEMKEDTLEHQLEHCDGKEVMEEEDLNLLKEKLKQGDYDGTDIMKAWIAIDELIELRQWRDRVFQAHPNIDLDIEYLAP